MSLQSDAFARHQQTRWMKPDAARWVRPDAARFVRPGSRVEDAFPALALKYNPDQPRVPAGEEHGGQWTSGGSSSGRPRIHIYRSSPTDDAPGDGGVSPNVLSADLMGAIDFGDISADIRSLDLFGTIRREILRGLVRLAGEVPRGIGDNGGPPLEDPPQIPQRMPKTRMDRMIFVRNAVAWLARVGRSSPVADAFFGAAGQIAEINRLTAIIRTGNDPAQSLDAARQRVSKKSEAGYHDHHIVNQHGQNRTKFGNEKIDGSENQVRILILKHLELSGWYATPNPNFGGLSPQNYLRGRSWEEQMGVGLQELRRRGIIE